MAPSSPRPPRAVRAARSSVRDRRAAPPATGGRVLPWDRLRRDRDRVARLQMPAQPPWLHALRNAYRWSTATALLLGIAAGAVYGRAAIVEQRWSRAYQRLQTLQRHERELQVNLAAIEDRLAREAADPAAQMDLPNPNNSLFLPPSNRSTFGDGSDRPNAVTAPTAQPTPQPRPLGY